MGSLILIMTVMQMILTQLSLRLTSKKSNVGSSSHFNENPSYYNVDAEHFRQTEWDYKWRLANSSISSAVGLQHIHCAYDEIQTPDLKLHLKASTISVKGIHSELDEMKKSHAGVKEKIDGFLLHTPNSAEIKSVKNTIKDVVKS